MKTEVVMKGNVRLIFDGKGVHNELDEGYRRGASIVNAYRENEIVTIVLDNVLFYRLVNIEKGEE